MEQETIDMTDRAWIGMQLIADKDREAVLAELEALRTKPPEQWPAKVLQSETGRTLYRMHGPKEYVVFFSVPGPGRLLFEDITNEGILSYFHGAKKEAR